MNNKINDGGAAFPVLITNDKEPHPLAETGMSQRDYFAAKAMQGMLANSVAMSNLEKDFGEDIPNIIVDRAYRIADAMIKEVIRFKL